MFNEITDGKLRVKHSIRDLSLILGDPNPVGSTSLLPTLKRCSSTVPLSPPSLIFLDMANKKPYGITNIKAYVPMILDLNELNYDAWCKLFTTHCKAFGVHGILTSTTKPTSPTDVEWENLNNIVQMWLYSTMTQPLLNMILKPDSTTKSVCLSVEALFRDNKDARVIELDNEIRSLVIGDRTIADYCQKLKSLSDLLANIDSPIPEKTLVTYMLNGLSPNLKTLLC
ncbi:uncharacterized protein LOC111914748 [Lactuca sativa]|uniref:uncharacterized protein LOC111914748 n=1 Tax=Lactuca sativa TaxID=4236 RepID=UPI000CD841ED|nr:uncharacterized protein LOC111914748 [Lactuca sativa]